MTPKTITTNSFELSYELKAASWFIMKYPIIPVVPLMKTFPIKVKTSVKEESIPNFIGFVTKSFIDSMHETQKLSE